MVSHYVHGRAGWLIPVALVSLAVASAAFLRLAATRTRGGRAGLWLLGVWTASVLLGAVFPTDPYGQWDRPPSPAGMVHGMAALVAFTILPAAAVTLTLTWRRSRRRQGGHRPAGADRRQGGPRPRTAAGWAERPLAVAAVVTVVAYLALLAAFVDVQDGPTPVGPWAGVIGLVERLALGSYVVWMAVAAAGLRRGSTLLAEPGSDGYRRSAGVGTVT